MNLDRALFEWINRGWSSSILDIVMPAASDFRLFLPVFGAVAAALVWRDRRRGVATLLALAVLLTATDQISSHVLKPAFARPRPCRPEAGLENVVVRARCSGKGSFPSSHAANIAAVTLLLLLRHRRWGWTFVPIAGLVGVSRVYLGVHYPLDVAGGWALGAGLGGIVALGTARVESLRFSERKPPSGVDSGAASAYASVKAGVGAQIPKAGLPHGDGHGDAHARGAPDQKSD